MREALQRLLSPKSVAVIGASRDKEGIGRRIFENIILYGFCGTVYPINPKAKQVASIKAYKSILDLPERVDLAIIVVPRDAVLGVAKECKEAGVKGLVVISSGFKEIGEEGAYLEQKLTELVRSSGMRMVGPNCMGIINTDPKIRLNATFAPTAPRMGKIGFFSQSGALGVTVLELASRLNIGISTFVSAGNKADVSGNDLLEYWEDDPQTKLILMYLESFGNPKKFITLAKRITRKKPIIIVKSARTPRGIQAASSHTGSLAGSEFAFDALFKQCGIIRATTIEEMFDIAMAFANQPIPRGKRIAIITNAGGPGIMVADACEESGLTLAELSESTRKYLKENLLSQASVENPVDLIASADESAFRIAFERILPEEEVDAVILISVSPIITEPVKVASTIGEIASRYEKPVFGCFMGIRGVAPSREELQKFNIPVYSFPESAVRAVSAMVKYREYLAKQGGKIPSFKIDKEKALLLIEKVAKERRSFLNVFEVKELLEHYGIGFAKTELATNLEEIFKIANSIGFPVVLKVQAEGLLHKTEIGAVIVDLRNESDLWKAYNTLLQVLQKRGFREGSYSFIVQEMVEETREVIMGITQLPDLGSLLMFGLGGIYVETLKDVVFRITPITHIDAVEMIRSIKGIKLLEGVRGEKPICFERLVDALLRLSQLAQDLPMIKELDLNPFMVSEKPQKCLAIDGRVLLK
jgi:acetyl coenzyme A synthetase (ADP forming)-like protein